MERLMHTFHAETLTDLHDLLCTKLVTSTQEELDIVSSVDVQLHNVIAECDSMDWDFDLKSMWLTKSRWSMMVKQYIDPDRLTSWIDMVTSKLGTKKRGIALMQFNEVKPRGGASTGHTNKQTRTWGACMKTLSYKALPEPTLVMHSRTSYLGYIGALDLTVAWMCAKILGEAIGLEPKDFRFVWMNEAIQWHNFKSLAFLLNHPKEKRRKKYRRLMMKPEKKLKDEELQMLKDYPGLYLSRKWLAKVIQEDKEGKTYGDMTYNTYRRIRRRWHTEVHGLEYAQQFEGWSRYKTGPKQGKKKEFFKAYGELPHCHVSTLDFAALKLPDDALAGSEFTGEDIEDDDDE